MSRGRAAGLALAVLVLAAGCVYYPMVTDLGGVRLMPTKGRVVREGAGAIFYAEIDSTGKFGDTLVHAETPIAHRVQLVDARGAPLPRLAVPAVSLVRLAPGAPHIVLADLTRPLRPGEVIIITLVFEKTGAVGVISTVE